MNNIICNLARAIYVADWGLCDVLHLEVKITNITNYLNIRHCMRVILFTKVIKEACKEYLLWRFSIIVQQVTLRCVINGGGEGGCQNKRDNRWFLLNLINGGWGGGWVGWGRGEGRRNRRRGRNFKNFVNIGNEWKKKNWHNSQKHQS